MISVLQLKKELEKLANPQKAKDLQRFFKTGKGEYGEGDIFIGITVPELRNVAKKYYELKLSEVQKLIESKIHEERMLALFILINKYNKTNHKKICFHFYIINMKYINNWDLVDLSAPQIVGRHLLNLNLANSKGSTASLSFSSEPSGNTQINLKNKSLSTAAKTSKEIPMEILRNTLREGPRPIDSLELLVRSENLWERRIGILATFWFIKNKRFDESLKLAQILLNDKHDLIHKAVGWMLREIGKRDYETEIKFLDKHYKKMSRTMLRYAIEKFPENIRQKYLGK
jgi:3-methyladenine DNA glycosylase AlkD